MPSSTPPRLAKTVAVPCQKLQANFGTAGRSKCMTRGTGAVLTGFSHALQRSKVIPSRTIRELAGIPLVERWQMRKWLGASRLLLHSWNPRHLFRISAWLGCADLESANNSIPATSGKQSEGLGCGHGFTIKIHYGANSHAVFVRFRHTACQCFLSFWKTSRGLFSALLATKMSARATTLLASSIVVSKLSSHFSPNGSRSSGCPALFNESANDPILYSSAPSRSI
jgi:hypothetical protein